MNLIDRVQHVVVDLDGNAALKEVYSHQQSRRSAPFRDNSLDVSHDPGLDAYATARLQSAFRRQGGAISHQLFDILELVRQFILSVTGGV